MEQKAVCVLRITRKQGQNALVVILLWTALHTQNDSFRKNAIAVETALKFTETRAKRISFIHANQHQKRKEETHIVPLSCAPTKISREQINCSVLMKHLMLITWRDWLFHCYFYQTTEAWFCLQSTLQNLIALSFISHMVWESGVIWNHAEFRVFWALSTPRGYIRAEGDFHKEMYSWKVSFLVS